MEGGPCGGGAERVHPGLGARFKRGFSDNLSHSICSRKLLCLPVDELKKWLLGASIVCAQGVRAGDKRVKLMGVILVGERQPF